MILWSDTEAFWHSTSSVVHDGFLHCIWILERERNFRDGIFRIPRKCRIFTRQGSPKGMQEMQRDLDLAVGGDDYSDDDYGDDDVYGHDDDDFTYC